MTSDDRLVSVLNLHIVVLDSGDLLDVGKSFLHLGSYLTRIPRVPLPSPFCRSISADDPIDPVGFLVVLVIAELVTNQEQDNQTSGETGSKTKYVDRCVTAISREISEGKA